MISFEKLEEQFLLHYRAHSAHFILSIWFVLFGIHFFIALFFD